MVEVKYRKLSIPDDMDTVEKLETHFKNVYPSIQIRITGPGYGSFPYSKKIPYILLQVDGNGAPINTYLYYLE